MPALADMWFSSAGSPENIYSDPAGEVCSDQWTACRQGLTVNPTLLTEAWQDVRVERHGAFIKDMLDDAILKNLSGHPENAPPAHELSDDDLPYEQAL